MDASYLDVTGSGAGLVEGGSMRKLVKAVVLSGGLAVAAMSSAQAAETTGGAMVEGCVSQAVAWSVATWGIAVLLAPFTAGSSLAAVPAVDVAVAGALVGCASGALGEGVAHAATN